MSETTYIKVSELYWVIEEFLGSAAGNVCTVEIRRLSDDYTWNFTTLNFTLAATTGTPVFVAGDAWKTSFTPPTEDTYIVTMIDTTLGLQGVQVLKAVGGDEVYSFSSVSETSIVNLALVKLDASRITSIDDESENARKAQAIYDKIRDEVLRAHPWNFAVDRVALALLASTPVFGYTYQFQIPTNCLRVLGVYDSGGVKQSDYKREGDKILCDLDAVYIKYIRKETDPNKYDANFIAAFSTRLAAELAYPITHSTSMGDTQLKLYTQLLAIAKSIDGQESSSTEVVGDEFIESRE
jgi:hypothetical protein